MNRKLFILLSCVIAALSSAKAQDVLSIPRSATAGVTDNSALPVVDPVLEQGIELYNAGNYMAALDKFMKVLRRDPKQPEAREYMRLVVDQLRSQRKPASAKTDGTAGLSNPQSSAVPASKATSHRVDAARRLRQRQLLTMDLAAIPGVTVQAEAKRAQVEIQTELLFADKTGGLKEDGVPILDRVAAWLKTFESEPIAIHCLPEENEDPSLGGSLFLHRYAQLYGFFIEERKLPAARFVTSGFAADSKTADAAQQAFEKFAVSSSSPRVVIVAFSGREPNIYSAMRSNPSRWLEFSVTAPRASFNPEEGDWVTLDLAALAAKEAKAWYFKIIGTGKEPVFSLEGRGNLLKRINWNGRDSKKGTFVTAGKYTARFTATNADGVDKTQEITLEVIRPQAAPVVAKKVAKKTKKAAAPVKKEAPQAVPSEVPVAEPSAADVSAPVAASEEPEQEPEPAGDSTNAIWKQVIQFDENESDLKPTLKASLERIGKTLEVYPLQKVRILGFATASEQNAQILARKRAEQIKDTLITEYRVDPSRVVVAGGEIGSSGKVEISITN